MNFKNDWHQELFNGLVARIGVWATKDKEYSSALFALASTEKRNMLRYADKEGIDFEKLMKDSEPWSSGERALVKLSATLFNSQAFPLTIEEIFYSLDHENIKVALEALAIRYN